MKTIVLAAMGNLLMATSLSYPVEADAHQASSLNDSRLRDYGTMSPGDVEPIVRGGGAAFLRGPTNNPLGTASGGPVRGLPDLYCAERTILTWRAN